MAYILRQERQVWRARQTRHLLATGDGRFATAQNFAGGRTPGSLTVGDFNGDGLLDLAIANGRSDTVAILINNTPTQ